ncbi:hypothetical protein KR054_011553 [Drosophila jambulina]|nr:hypothetical protein KR054_011553 [Drosophila jambulina]
MLVHCLVASPAPARSTEAWSADKACADEKPMARIKNQNDSTCASFILCYKDNDGLIRPLVKNCGNEQYFNASLRYCSVTKPDGCV